MTEQENGERGVSPGNKQGNIGVIDSPPYRFDVWLPIDPVIKGATSKEGDCRQGKNAQSDATAQFVGQCNKNQPGYQGDRGHDEVNQTPEFGLGQFRLRRFSWFFFGCAHGSTINPEFVGSTRCRR